MSTRLGANTVTKDSAERDEVRYDALKAERDRFVALAFCNADLLLELDGGGHIAFACGATKLLLGRTPEQLNGDDIASIVAPADRNVIKRLLGRAKSGGRLDNMRIRLVGNNGPTPPVVLNGFSLADMGGQTYLALRVEAAAPMPFAPVAVKRDEASGTLDRDTFSDAAGAAMRAANDHGEEVELTFIELGNWQDVEARLEGEARDELLSNIGACLRASSVTGDTAGRLDAERYGLVHWLGANIDAVVKEIGDCTRQLDPKGIGAEVSNTTVAMDAANANGADTTKLLRYTINKYCEKTDEAFSITSLSEGLSALTNETVERMSHSNASSPSRSSGSRFSRSAISPRCGRTTSRRWYASAAPRRAQVPTSSSHSQRRSGSSPSSTSPCALRSWPS